MADDNDKSKDGVKPTEDTPAPAKGEADKKTKSPEEYEAHIAALNKENEKRRKENAELKAQFEGLQKSLKTALGAKDEDPADAALKSAQEAAAAKQKNLLLRSEFYAIASKEGVVDPATAYKAFRDELADVTVDLDKESVDTTALTAKVQSLKKSHAYFFAGANQQGSGGSSNPVDPPPDKSGHPASGAKQHYETWRQMLREAGASPSLRMKAAEYFTKHQKDIQPFIANGG